MAGGFYYNYLNKLIVYKIYIVSNITPLGLVIVFFFPIKQNAKINIVVKVNNNKLYINGPVNASGVIIAPMPIIKKEFKRQEPTKFPTAKFSSFLITATTDVISSGKAVPIATIVKPIKISGM